MTERGGQVESDRLADRARELARRAGGAAPGHYFAQLLGLLQEALGSRYATVWGIDQHGVLTRIAEVAADPRGTRLDVASMSARTSRVLDALASVGLRTRVVNGGAADRPPAAELEALAPIHDGVRPCGVLEVVVPHDPEDESRVEWITNVVNELAAQASTYVKSLLANAGSPNVDQFAERLHRVALALHGSGRVDELAMIAVNEGRHLLGFDRLSLAVRRGRRIEVAAVSGQPTVAVRSNLVRALHGLAQTLIEIDHEFRFNGDGESLPPQVRDAVLEFARESCSRSIEAFPIRLPCSDDAAPQDAMTSQQLGILLGENFKDAAPTNSAHVDAFASHVAIALDHSQRWDRTMTALSRGWRMCFGPGEFRSPRRAVLWSVAAAATMIAIGMAPVAYRVEASGRLLPRQRSRAFAPVDGRVSEVLVEGNERVEEGQLLLRLENDRLAGEILTTRHHMQEKSQLLATLEAQQALAQDRGQGQDAIRLAGAISQTRIELASLKGQLDSLLSESQELDVRAPSAGIIVTFEPKQLLLHRPVRRGDVLLEVMDTDGRWELVVELPAHRVGCVLEAQAVAGDAATPVEFSLATEPERVHVGALRTAPSRIVAGSDGNPTASLEINVAASEIAHPVAGADVIARIDCGKRALAWVLFGDVVDFFRRRFW